MDKMWVMEQLIDDDVDSVRRLLTTADFSVAAQTTERANGMLTTILLCGLGDQETLESTGLYIIADRDALIMLRDAIDDQLETYGEPAHIDEKALEMAQEHWKGE
jgi:hypothetical protein